MVSTEYLRQTLLLAQNRYEATPATEVFSYIVSQLEYLIRVMSGEETDHSNMKSIMLGHYAVREFGQSDPVFAAALIKVQSTVYKMQEETRNGKF